MPYRPARALELLRAGTSNSASAFRQGQEEAIEHVVERRGRLLVVQKTGWGKSFVYFIATKLLREEGEGPALPLVGDMEDSRWTITVAAWLLRTHGSGEVWPLALAQTGRGE